MHRVDFHTHTLLSDGELLVSELVRRASIKGYSYIGLTDHVDSSNLDFVVPRLVKACKLINKVMDIKAIPGIEITHVHPQLIGEMAKEARKLGAKVIIVHGETVVEPVLPGTNLAALNCDIDILAHPGLISEEEVNLAKSNNIFLELTSRKGHCLTNGHVARLSTQTGARLVIDSDAHSPEDLLEPSKARSVALGAGLTEKIFLQICEQSFTFAQNIFSIT